MKRLFAFSRRLVLTPVLAAAFAMALAAPSSASTPTAPSNLLIASVQPGAAQEEPVSGLVIYVAPNGNDSNPGTQGSPKRTLAGARNAIRAATGRTADGKSSISGSWTGATVIFAAGTYFTESATAFDERDSGTETHPIVYRAASGAQVKLTGAFQVPDNAWKPVSSSDSAWGLLPAATRSKTYKLDVGALGISAGSLSTGSGPAQDSYLRLIEKDTMRTLARWPDGDEQTAEAWVKAVAWTSSPNTITIPGTTTAGWSLTGQNPLMYGALRCPYNINWTVPTGFQNVDGKTKITFNFGSSVGDPMAPFIAIRNMLQTLNMPGEYVWNISNRMIYLLPTGEGPPSGVSLNLADRVITFGAENQSSQATHWMTLKDLIIEGSRVVAVRGDHGTGLLIDGCEVRNFSGTVGGVHFQYCTRTGLVNCRVHRGAKGAILLHGGDHRLLNDARNFIKDTELFDIGIELNATISVAIETRLTPYNHSTDGSGLTISGLNAYDIRDGVIALNSARMIIENSTFNRFCTITGDAGGLTAAFAYTNRYGVIRNNTFSNMRRLGDLPGHENDFQHQSFGALNALYLDLLAGWTIEDNTFINCDHAMQIGAGKDHVIRRNKFIDCHIGTFAAPVLFAGRLAHTGVPLVVLTEDFDHVPLESAPWSKDFSKLIQYRVGGPLRSLALYPENITFVDNLTMTGKYLATIRNGTAPVTVNGVQVGVDWNQLNYPVGASGSPQAGGGTVPLTSIKN